MLRFYITPNMGIPTIQRWQNGHWIFDRWPTNEEITEEKVLDFRGSLNSNAKLKDISLEHSRFNADVLPDYGLYNINKAKEIDDRMRHATWPMVKHFIKISDERFPLITDSQIYPVDIHNPSHKYLLTQMELESDCIQGDKGSDYTWRNYHYEGGYCPRRCRCACCGRLY